MDINLSNTALVVIALTVCFVTWVAYLNATSAKGGAR